MEITHSSSCSKQDQPPKLNPGQTVWLDLLLRHSVHCYFSCLSLNTYEYLLFQDILFVIQSTPALCKSKQKLLTQTHWLIVVQPVSSKSFIWDLFREHYTVIIRTRLQTLADSHRLLWCLYRQALTYTAAHSVVHVSQHSMYSQQHLWDSRNTF